MSRESDFDHIVVGAGSAGCVVAARLAEAGRRVLLIEAGKPGDREDDVKELERWKNLVGTDYDYDYAITDQPRGNSTIRHTRGKMLGGTGSINTCIAFKCPAADLDRWAGLEGAAGWDAESCDPHFDRVFEQVNIETGSPDNPFHHDLIQAAAEAGLPEISFNSEEIGSGIGYLHFSKSGIYRESAATAYLLPLEQWGDRLTVVSETCVSRLIFDEAGRAIGVDSDTGRYFSSGEIILAAGAFNTPTILMRSGIGPAEHLREHSIDVRLDHPGIGQNLVDHPDTMIAFEATRPIPQTDANGLGMALFFTSDEKFEGPDVMAHVGTKVFDTYTLPKGYPTAEHGFSFSPNVTRAKSLGTVRLRSTDPQDPLVIDFDYFSHPGDEQALVEGLKLARRVAAQPSMQGWIKRELFPGEAIQADEDLSAYGRQVAGTVYHPAGTCKIGADDDPMAVVDSNLKLRGVDNVVIADASVFPSMIGVNPNLTIMMIGEKCAAGLIRPIGEEIG